MARSMTWLVLLGMSVTPAASASVSPVQKVIAIVDEMAGKTTADRKASVEDFRAFSQFCDKSATEKSYAMKKSGEAIESLEAAVEDANAKIAAADSTVAELSTSISDAQGDLQKTIDGRKAEHADFLAAEKETVDTVETLQAAAKATASSFTQLATVGFYARDSKHYLDAMRAALKVVVEAGFVTHAQTKRVASFLEATEDSELTMKTHSKDDDAAAETMKMLVEMTEKTLSDMRQKEMKANQAFLSTKLSMEHEIKSMTEEMQAQQALKQSTTETLATATKDLSTEKKVLAENQKFSDDLKRDCETKTEEFEVVYKDATAELKALAQAKEILQKGVKASFLETGNALRSSMVARVARDDGKARALRAIQMLGRKLHSTALVSLAYRAAADPFSKVRSMIEEMIAKLLHEGAEAATKEAFCKEEQAKSVKSQTEKGQALAKTEARIGKAESGMATLAEQVAMLSKEVSELDASLAEATALRTSESTSFKKSDADLSASVTACNDAIKVLSAYYEGAASLLQRGRRTAVASSAASGARTTGGAAVLDVLRFAENDFAMQMSEGRAAETEAADQYAALKTEAKQLKAVKLAEIKGKESEAKTLKSSLANYGADKEGISAELDAVTEYLAELKPKCATAVPSYAEQKAARQQEINGLKDALKLLA